VAPAGEARRRLAGQVRALREGLAADREAGIDWIPWEGAPPAERLAAPRPRPPRAAAIPRAAREKALAAVAAEVARCTACRLCEGRTNTVPGEGDPEAAVMFVGEGPGEQEDLSGRPFVGRAGQLLRTLIREELGLDPAAVFIANIVKCRPPQNRAPEPDEAAACLPFLRRQVAAVRPRVLVTLGNPSTQSLLQTTVGITKMRGKPVERGGFLFFPTYHPSYLLRNQAALPEGRADFRAVRALLARPAGGG
jgi:uracil-DNA glycosylase family 4